jgi:NADH:ubiquinone oxidoreductase subunit 4 (subunit M)
MVNLIFFDSTISHIGFILLALAISTEQSIESFIFYIIQYSITNLNTFLILIALSYLIYNSDLQKNFVKIIKNNYYFSIIFISLDSIKSNKFKFNNIKLESLINLLPKYIFKSKNSIIIN